jgi:hypothetical protein
MESPPLLLKEDTQVIRELNLQEAPSGRITRYWVHLVTNGMGMPTYVPIIVAKGEEDGPALGITAAVHGNELNGVSVIQRLFRELDVRNLKGTVVGIPVVNIPSLLANQREFIDGTDINDIMPGKAKGNMSEVYAYRFVNRVVKEFDYLVDLHTASFGRINSYYIRADMDNPVTRQMALLQNAEIVVNNAGTDGTLRGAAGMMGIHAITLELGNPHTFQKNYILWGLAGIHNLMVHFSMTDSEIEQPTKPPVICRKSYWIYTDTGGILTVQPDVTDFVRANERIATLRNIFGDMIKDYLAPEDGIVIGKSVAPVNQTGGRIVHLGIL